MISRPLRQFPECSCLYSRSPVALPAVWHSIRVSQYPLERPHQAVSPLFGSLCDTHLKPLHLTSHFLPCQTIRQFPVLFSAGRRINCPGDSSHLLSFLKRFFKFSRNGTPDGRLHPYGPDNISLKKNGEGSIRIQRATAVIRFSHHLHPYQYFHGPLFRSACR